MSFQPAKRMRHGVGSFDADSDEEFDVDITATLDSSSETVIMNPSLYPSKRAKVDQPSQQPPIPLIPVIPEIVTTVPPSSGSIEDQVNEIKKDTKRKQGASVIMGEFSKHFDELQTSILYNMHHRDLGRPCACGSKDAIYRCSGPEKCSDACLQCVRCLVHAHASLPFHRVEAWNGKYFVLSSLQALGYVLHLGHHGGPCPHISSRTPPRMMTAVHTNGFHKFPVHFCYCDGAASEPIQLSDQGFFPGTMTQPESFYSFGVLENFHAHTLSSKKSLYDYHDALVKLTNAAFPQDVPNRYHEFGQISRIWAHLAVRRRSGQDHDIDEEFPGRRKHSLAVRCPACSELGVNVDKETIEIAGEEEAHKYTLFISADGNFRLQRKHKKGDPDDVALNKGNGYFVDAEGYRIYLLHVGDCTDNCVCNHIRANRLQNIIKFKNAVISGVIAIQCARHGFYLPQGMVDLTKGESFSRTDYALACGTADMRRLRWIMLSYDIWCSYSIKLKDRFRKYFPKAVELIENMRGAIPKMHIKNHMEACQLLWAFNYLVCSGETYGEKIESSWGEGNQAAGTTKEMNDGHRHDALDDFHGYWNWCKLHKLPKALYSSYTKCLDTLKSREKNFQEFEKCISDENRTEWSAMNDKPRMEGGEVISVHVAKFKDGPPTQLSAYKALLQEEIQNELEGQGRIGETQFMNNALKIEHDQQKACLLAAIEAPTPAESTALLDARKSLRQYLVVWRSHQFDMYPNLHDCIGAVDPGKPELEPLLLPSSFSPTLRAKYGLENLAKVEYRLREGRAHDALDDVRTSIKIFNHNFDFKKNNVFGQGPNTRAQTFLKTLAKDKVSGADKYRVQRKALLALGLLENDQVLQELLDSQLWGRDYSRPARLGDSRRDDPWFWHVGRPSGLTEKEQKEWSTELDRVKYFRDRSARDRAKEEKEVLEEEFKRTICYFQYLRNAWIHCALKKQDTVPGYVAYAYKQAAMYGRFAAETTKLSVEAKKKCDVYDKWATSFVPEAVKRNETEMISRT